MKKRARSSNLGSIHSHEQEKCCPECRRPSRCQRRGLAGGATTIGIGWPSHQVTSNEISKSFGESIRPLKAAKCQNIGAGLQEELGKQSVPEGRPKGARRRFRTSAQRQGNFRGLALSPGCA
jgi:hypothetical protein